MTRCLASASVRPGADPRDTFLAIGVLPVAKQVLSLYVGSKLVCISKSSSWGNFGSEGHGDSTNPPSVEYPHPNDSIVSLVCSSKSTSFRLLRGAEQCGHLYSLISSLMAASSSR